MLQPLLDLDISTREASWELVASQEWQNAFQIERGRNEDRLPVGHN